MTAFFFSLATWANAQNENACRTYTTEESFAQYPAVVNSTNPSSGFTLNLYVYLVRPTDGNGGISRQMVEESIANLEAAFGPHDIFFNHGCIIEIWDDALYQNGALDACRLLHGTDHPYWNSNGLCIYYGSPNSLPFNQASNIPGNRVIIIGSINGVPSAQAGLVQHEVGHCLGLLHTFHSEGANITGECPNAPLNFISGCKELVNGSNSTNCGDKVIFIPGEDLSLGTPADPGMNWNVDGNTCLWNGSGVDANNDPYDPDERNYMAYAHPNCMNRFAIRQRNRMHSFIENAPVLIKCRTAPNNPGGVVVEVSTVWTPTKG
jgi:hypothetical protein